MRHFGQGPIGSLVEEGIRSAALLPATAAPDSRRGGRKGAGIHSGNLWALHCWGPASRRSQKEA